MSVTITDIAAAFDSRAQYFDAEGESSPCASCDFYEFNDGRSGDPHVVYVQGSRAD
jgi:hypothetical protein